MADMEFSHTSNQENSYLWEWNYWQPQLAQEDCDLVVVVCHTDKDELVQLAAATSGIDLLVGGDGPADADQFLNADKEPVSYVCGGGTALTQTIVTLDADGTPVLGSSTLQDLRDQEDDPSLAQAMSPYFADAKQAGSRQTGTLSGSWQDNHSLTRQTDTADLVGEAHAVGFRRGCGSGSSRLPGPVHRRLPVRAE